MTVHGNITLLSHIYRAKLTSGKKRERKRNKKEKKRERNKKRKRERERERERDVFHYYIDETAKATYLSD